MFSLHICDMHWQKNWQLQDSWGEIQKPFSILIRHHRVFLAIYGAAPAQLLTNSYQLLTNNYQLFTNSHQLLTNSYQLLTNSYQLLTKSYQLLTNSYQLLTNSYRLLTNSFNRLQCHVHKKSLNFSSEIDSLVIFLISTANKFQTTVVQKYQAGLHIYYIVSIIKCRWSKHFRLS